MIAAERSQKSSSKGHPEVKKKSYFFSKKNTLRTNSYEHQVMDQEYEDYSDKLKMQI